MKEQYEGGRSIRAIAEAYGRSYGFVHRVLTEEEPGDVQRGSIPSRFLAGIKNGPTSGIGASSDVSIVSSARIRKWILT
ncbi:helix-turn-helix domain-containing protein [Streptomyces lavenduligriseus]|uniref:helix-turn-helix domain-containing protein n=1 Tax=Streptomyces lavenduligriseus TaxID=67315 RepID=UPI003FD77828